MFTFLLPAIKPTEGHYEHHVSLPSPSILIGDENDGWLNKHRQPPEIGKPIRVRYLDLVEGIAVRKSDLQYTLRNGDPVSGVIEWQPLEGECVVDCVFIS